MPDIKKLLMSMPELTSVSGFERDGIESFKELTKPYFDEIIQTASDSLICYKYSAPEMQRQSQTLLIDTHFDEIGMMVSRVKVSISCASMAGARTTTRGSLGNTGVPSGTA